MVVQICNINSHYCIFLCWIPPWGWPENSETCRRITTCLSITVSNYNAVFGIHMVTCLTEWNMNNFKFMKVIFYWENFMKYCQFSIRLYNINNYWTVCIFSNMCISISAQYMHVHMNALHSNTVPTMLSYGSVAMIHSKTNYLEHQICCKTYAQQ
jgi:hypothetical protein